MTLDEAIQHAEDRGLCQDECGAEHRQLAEWLRELRLYRIRVGPLPKGGGGWQQPDPAKPTHSSK